MEKLYGEDNKLPLSNISFNSSRDYKVPKCGETFLAYFFLLCRYSLNEVDSHELLIEAFAYSLNCLLFVHLSIC